MTTIIASDKFIKTYTNKNGSVFKAATNLACNSINNGQYGIIYDDFNPDMKKVNQWKKECNNLKIFHVATRGKTLHMDSKISFHNKMSESKYTPESYLEKTKVTDKNGIYFVKTDGSTGSRGVNVYTYNQLEGVDISNSVIQKSMSEPDLHNKKRYKIRQLVFLHNKSCYIHKESLTTLSDVNYDSNSTMHCKHVIFQKTGTEFILSKNLPEFTTIYKNMLNGVTDFAKVYNDEIQNINENEFVILGFDFVVDKDKNVQIIEINHRSNYSHPQNVSDICDINGIKDLLLLLINQSTENTNLIKI